MAAIVQPFEYQVTFYKIKFSLIYKLHFSFLIILFKAMDLDLCLDSHHCCCCMDPDAMDL